MHTALHRPAPSLTQMNRSDSLILEYYLSIQYMSYWVDTLCQHSASDYNRMNKETCTKVKGSHRLVGSTGTLWPGCSAMKTKADRNVPDYRVSNWGYEGLLFGRTDRRPTCGGAPATGWPEEIRKCLEESSKQKSRGMSKGRPWGNSRRGRRGWLVDLETLSCLTLLRHQHHDCWRWFALHLRMNPYTQHLNT